MHSGKRFGAREFVNWTRRSIYVLTVLAAIPTFYIF
jgi:putative membrane protein